QATNTSSTYSAARQVRKTAALTYVWGQSRCRRPVRRKKSSTRRRRSAWNSFALAKVNFLSGVAPRPRGTGGAVSWVALMAMPLQYGKQGTAGGRPQSGGERLSFIIGRSGAADEREAAKKQGFSGCPAGFPLRVRELTRSRSRSLESPASACL